MNQKDGGKAMLLEVVSPFFSTIVLLESQP